MTHGLIENTEMYRHNVGHGRMVLKLGIITSYLDAFTLLNKNSVHLHRCVQDNICLIIMT